MQTNFGRQLEVWECEAGSFCDRGNIDRNSPMGQTIYRLSDKELLELSAVVDPSVDFLIHVDCDGFTVNHGNVGSNGIRYDFNR